MQIRRALGTESAFVGTDVGLPIRLKCGRTLLTARFHFEMHSLY
jgi:hypothetical protein